MVTRQRPLLFAGAMVLSVIALWLLCSPRGKTRVVARLGSLVWKRNQFCRGWLITGDTGSGKTSSGINQIAHQVFQNEPRWGGLCIDEKGVYWETLAAMARHYRRETDLIHLQIPEEDANPHWNPAHRYNLTGDRSIPFTTYAKFVVDTATSLGPGGDKGFFKSQAQTHIAHALELLYEMKRPVTRPGAFELLSNRDQLEDTTEDLADLLETPCRAAVRAHFLNRFLNQPDEQLGGVRETIGNYLQYFLTPEIAEVFCTGDSTFDFAAIDRGKIILTTMPQKFQTERRYVNTFLKLLYYNHALRRFDKPKSERARDNLLILYIRRMVKIEMVARADHWPCETKTVTPYVAEQFPQGFKERSCAVKVLSAERTFWEKATILHAEFHRPADKAIPERFSRHYCDFYELIRKGVAKSAAEKPELLARVAEHKSLFFRSASAKYGEAVRGTLRIAPPEHRLKPLRDDYARMQQMFFGEPPGFESIISLLSQWKLEFNRS